MGMKVCIYFHAMLSFLSTTNSFSDATCTEAGTGAEACADTNAFCPAGANAKCTCKADFTLIGNECTQGLANGKLISM